MSPTDAGFGAHFDTGPLTLKIGNSVTFAVRANSSDPAKGIGYYNGQLNFVVATINDKTDNLQKVDSPFLIPFPNAGGVWPLMLGNRDGGAGLNTFFHYDQNTGALVSKENWSSNDYLGLMLAVVKDTGAFEVVVCAEVNGRNSGDTLPVYCQFSRDPEIGTGP